ncbi:MAG: UDP-N-acetylmuramate--L-alanine ligase [Verrucomicrobiota bacterium]
MNAATTENVNAILQNPGAVVYLVGAGGCGMSGLGHLLIDLGHRVVGSDLVVNEETRQLRARGAEIHSSHAADQLRAAEPALVVYTSAVRWDNPELQAAEKLRIPIVRRAVLLAALQNRQRGICVAGTHGKTTTSALLTFALDRLGLKPSYAIGALVPQLPASARFSKTGAPGTQPYFVVEADESDGSLREFQPEHSIVLNVDAEHLDFYSNLEAIGQEFGQFASQTRGHLVFCADDSRLAELFARRAGAVSYGFHPLAAYRCELKTEIAANRRERSKPETLFSVWHNGEKLGEHSTSLIGEKNVSNATAVVALIHQLGFPAADIARAIAPFRGAARRQQELFSDGRVRIFDDYGHHPAEIRATLQAFRALGPRRLLVAFQPHRFTRTQCLLQEFATCFRDADVVWLAEVYAASEPPIPGVNSALLADAIRAQGQAVEFIPSTAELRAAVRTAMQPGDLVVFLGAGPDITNVAHELAAQLGEEGARVKDDIYGDLAARLSKQTIVRRDESLARRTTLRVGGTADIYVEPASEAELAEVLKFCAIYSLPFVMLGRGSNLLIRDGGIRGAVISLAHAHFSRIEVVGDKIHCGAGLRLKTVAVEARRQGLTGFEFLEGIPGSVGGAMRMNAGAMGAWIFDVIERIRFMDYSGQVHEHPAAEITVEYRGCPLFKNHIALGAVLKGQLAPNEAIKDRMDAFSRKRWDSQPNQPSAGCIFKNPKPMPAGKLIEELGLKGTRVGGAMVSDVHANFIVNDGTATARDVLNLIEIIRQRAKSTRGIELETEVEILGEG